MSEPVTIRERVHEALDGAGPTGLSMSALAAAVSGPFGEAGVRGVVRKLWQSGELTRREDGTFVRSGRCGRNGNYRLQPSATSIEHLEAAVRRVANAGEQRPPAPMRTFKVDPAQLKALCPTCRATVFPKRNGRCPACASQTGADLEAIYQHGHGGLIDTARCSAGA